MSAGRFALKVVAAAAASAALLLPLNSWSLGLGRLTVQSSLGEVLRAEIDISSLTPEEAGNLKVKVASPETYRAAGVDYNSVLPSTNISLQRRSDGRAFLRITSDRPVQEPFVDVILELSWSSGRLVREYTLLFDPPTTRAQAPAQGAGPAISAAPAPAPVPAAPVAPPAAEPVPAPSAARTPEAQPKPAEPAPRPAAPAPAVADKKPAARHAAPVAPKEPEAAEHKSDKAEADTVRVRRGDTLSRIAARSQRAGVSLDQMLVGLYQANPDAFAGNNMNRLKSGVVLNVPDADKLKSLSAGEARRVIQAQSADFNTYRQRLAGAVPAAPVDKPQRQASGKVEAEVQDRKQSAAPAPDKLTLSKGGTISGTPTAEDKLAKDRAKKDSASRVAELSKNLEDLKKLQQGAASAPAAQKPAAATTKPPAPASSPALVHAPAPAVPASKPAAPASKPAATPAPTKVASAPAPAPVPASQPQILAVKPPPAPASAPAPAPLIQPAASAPAPLIIASAPAPASAALAASAPAVAIQPAASAPETASAPIVAQVPAVPASKPAPRPHTPQPAPTPPAEEPGVFESLLDNPMLMPAAVLLVALLAGVGFYQFRSRRKSDSGETSFLESRLQPDSFFGASGGQRIDTRDASGGPSSMSYSLSQLDAIGDVDPVAEADVYLAYGRDLQAEEILKEAMRSAPERLAIRLKLLEVYAKRRDTKGFEQLAVQLYGLTQGQGDDWTKAQELGASIDPENPLYQPGGKPSEPSRSAVNEARITEPLEGSTMPQSILPVTGAGVAGFGAGAMGASVNGGNEVDVDLDLDAATSAGGQDSGGLQWSDRPAPVTAPAPLTPASSADFDLDLPDLDAPPPAAAPAPSSNSLNFDLGDISLDLDAPAPAAASAPFQDVSTLDLGAPADLPDGGDPLQRKVELAEEFRQIGDIEGARDLLEEVVARADGALRAKAQAMLDQIR